MNTPSAHNVRHYATAPVAIASAALMVTLAACGNGGGDDSSAGTNDGGGGDDVVLGVAMKTQQQIRWEFDVRAMQQKADELGVELVVQWANDNAATQATQIENLLSQGVDALIINPVDGDAAGTAATQAKSEGVPVVAYDIGIEGVPVDYFVIRDNPKVGVLQAQAALEFNPDGKYALVEGDPANDVAQAIHEGHLETLQGESPEIVYDQFTKNWDPQTALSNAESILSSNTDDISAFLTANDGMATGVVRALRARGLAGEVFVSGLDADAQNLKLIDEGAQTMSVWTQIDEQGSLAVEVAADLAAGEDVEADTTVDNGSDQEIPARVAPVVSITKDNLCEFVNTIAPEGWVTAEDVFADPSQCPAE